MFVYVKDGMIIGKSSQRLNNSFTKGCDVIVSDMPVDTYIIYEDNQVKDYYKSRQYKEDHNIHRISKELEHVKKENEKLETIANDRVKEDLEIKTEVSEFERDLYLLKHIGDVKNSSNDR